MSLHHSTLTYETLPKVSETNPGMKPLEFNCLVLPRVVQRQRASGIFVPETSAQREDEGGDEGLLVSISPLAFNEDDFPNPDAIPKVGERVMFARYAGKSFVGADGRVYRVMKDKEIVGIRTADAESAKVAA
jgi:co-chaperonin GroES (HSP10)